MSKKLRKKLNNDGREVFEEENSAEVAQTAQTEKPVQNQSVIVVKEKKARKPRAKK